jgi:hypothetical protein
MTLNFWFNAFLLLSNFNINLESQYLFYLVLILKNIIAKDILEKDIEFYGFNLII